MYVVTLYLHSCCIYLLYIYVAAFQNPAFLWATAQEFACYTRMHDIRAVTSVCMLTIPHARKEISIIMINSINCASARDYNGYMHCL